MAPRNPARFVHPGRRQRGSLLLVLSIIMFMFVSVSAVAGLAQILAARSFRSEAARTQAQLAAEAGLNACFDASADIPLRVLASPAGEVVTYQASWGPAGSPAYLQATGTVTESADKYVATASCLVFLHSIVEWNF